MSLCHGHGVPVLVDEAHGSHLRALDDPSFRDALACGADLVVQSSHKTLTALSQAAMLHLGQEAFACTGATTAEVRLAVQQSFSLLTTTSPNALLLASLDAARAQFAVDGAESVPRAAAAVNELRDVIRTKLSGSVALLEDSSEVEAAGLRVDPLRLSLRFLGRPSLEVDADMEEDDGIFCELNGPHCITYAVPPLATGADLEPLTASLLRHAPKPSSVSWDRDSRRDSEAAVQQTDVAPDSRRDETSAVLPLVADICLVLTTLAYESPSTSLSLEDALGHISAETVSLYPPGVPLVVAGERLTSLTVATLTALRDRIRIDNLGSGCFVTGSQDATMQTIRVCVC